MSFVCAVLYFRMEYWDAYPAIESDLSFAQTTHSNIPVHLDWRGSCRLKDAAPMQTEMNQNKALVKASSMIVPKSPPDKMANQATLVKNTLSERSQLYGSWLQGLREIASDLPSAHETFKSIVDENARLPELLKFVMAELEHKLALDEFKTESSERGFWISVKAMANSYGIDFSDFEKVCCSSEFKGLNCPLDGGIPGLVDQGHEAHWNFSQNSFHLTHPSGDISISELPSYPPPEYPSMASVGVFQPFPLDAARDDTYTTPSPASFGQSPFPDYQSTILPTFGINSPEQGHCYAPSPLYTSLCTRKTILDSSFIRKTSTILSTARTPRKHKSNQCLSVCLKTKEAGPHFPTIVPEACRRKIQRQRRRAMSYNHLATSFGASKCSLTWNASSTEDSDLQFLLEKELKRSDVGSLGRIILPKRQAEEKLPYLEAKEGVTLAFEDLQTSRIWNLRFRFWPNNKTRMYLLESTGSFVRSHHLQEGDYIVLYKNPATGNYMINGKKSALPKVLGMSEQRSLPSSSEICGSGGESSLEPAFDPPTKAPEKESTTQLETMMDAKNSSSLTETDLVASGSCYMEYMEDSDDVIKGFSTFEADGRSIDEIFDFKE